jgi:hypothetical protein
VPVSIKFTPELNINYLEPAAAAAGYGLYSWIEDRPRDGIQPGPFRRAFQLNAKLSRGLFDERALAPTYPVSRATGSNAD